MVNLGGLSAPGVSAGDRPTDDEVEDL